MFRVSYTPPPVNLQPRWEADHKRLVCFPGERREEPVVVPQSICAFESGPGAKGDARGWLGRGLVYAHRRPEQGLQYLELQDGVTPPATIARPSLESHHGLLLLHNLEAPAQVPAASESKADRRW